MTLHRVSTILRVFILSCVGIPPIQYKTVSIQPAHACMRLNPGMFILIYHQNLDEGYIG